MLLTTNPKQLFLIDGIGALVSALFLGVVFVQLESAIGMPKNILYGLALAPCFFAMYSFGCYFFVKSSRSPYLKFIAICNLLYCCTTIWLVYGNYENLTSLGLFYFIVELIVILILVGIEIRSANSES